MRGAALLFYEKEENMIMKMKRAAASALTALALGVLCCVPAFAADGDVAGAVEQTWTDASEQIKTVVDNVDLSRPEHGAGHRLLRQAGHGLTSTIASTASLSGQVRPFSSSA